ncbi:MAG: HAMP domain-containing histidine kinase [Clostridiales bacterium]|nr:HAMP domain-containing histidine kinase [Clostridiales bacterium]
MKKGGSTQRNTPKQPRRPRGFIRKRKSASIFFLLWSIFSIFSLFIVLGLGISQQVIIRQSYKDEAAHEVTRTGKEVERAILEGPSDSFGGNYSGFLHFLSDTHDVQIAIINGEGKVEFPQEPNFDENAPEIEEHYDFSKKLARMKKELADHDGNAVVYEEKNTYVYGAEIEIQGGENVYLYVGKSLSVLGSTTNLLMVRTIVTGIFVLVVAFAVSSALSGWLTKPISEMTDKARKLAEGDFNVDFHGANYGEEMVALASTLNFARDELSKTDRMQKELIANVSHDFKTPLTMIKAYASMIMEISGANPEKRNKHAQVIVDEADRLTSLVNDVLDLSKISAGLAELKMTRVDMSGYVDEVLSRFQYLTETQGYKFHVDVEEGLYTMADEGKIGQVLYNLIGNAVNYTGEDKNVYIRMKKESDEYFRFEVRDSGSGIPRDELNGIWDRYYRSQEMHKRPVKGTGLGLSIVKSILECHRFVFGVESEVGKGSVFYVLFPLVDKNA